MRGTNQVSQFKAVLFSLEQSGSVGPDLCLGVVGVVWHPAVLVVHPCCSLRYRDV